MKRLLPNSLNLPSNWRDVRTRALVPAGAKVGEWRDWVVDNDPVYGSFRRPGRTEKIAASVTLLLIAVVVLPLFIPPVVFGSGALDRAAAGLSPLSALALLTAYVLFAAVIAPPAGAAAIRSAQS